MQIARTTRNILPALALVLLAACGGSDGDTPSAATKMLMSVGAEAAGANCAEGGSRIEAGLDLDRNGALGPDEVTSTRYACNGATGAAGSAGASGGNGNGVAGTNGSDGASTLMSFEPSATCPHGGSKITAWLDLTPDGVPDPQNEPSTVGEVCNGAPGFTMNWVPVTASRTADPDTGYFLAAGSETPVVLTLPAEPDLKVGQVVHVTGGGMGSWKIAQNPGQVVNVKQLVGSFKVPVGLTSIASSSDGSKLVAVGPDTPTIYMSANGGGTWTEHVIDGAHGFGSVSSTDDGMTLLAAEPRMNWRTEGRGTFLHQSSDGGGQWDSQGFADWTSLVAAASSSSGQHLVVSSVDIYSDATLGNINVSPSHGALWEGIGSATLGWWWTWDLVDISDDGTRVVAVGQGTASVFDKEFIGEWIWTKNDIVIGVGAARAAALSDSGTTLLVAGLDTPLYVATGNELSAPSPTGHVSNWSAVAVSGDASTLLAAQASGLIHVSTDQGANWKPTGPVASWRSLACSEDGSRFAAVSVEADGSGIVYTSRPTTTAGEQGWISGGPKDSIELIYSGNGRFEVLGYQGSLTIH